jgi:putative inorganic carbon (hco3(-)) transporter
VSWAFIGLATAAICGLGLVLSWSRGAWLAAACAAAALAGTWLVGVLRPPVSRRAVLVIACVALVVVGAVLVGGARLPNAIGARLASIAQTFAVWGVGDAEVDDASFATIERVAHWEAAARMWSDAPWLGQGPGHFEVVYGQYRLPSWPEPLGHAHNAYLQLLAEAGLIGLAGYLAFFLAALAVAARAALHPVSAWHGALGLGLVGVLAALAFHNLVDYLFVHDLTVHLGLLLGLTVAAGRTPAWSALP